MIQGILGLRLPKLLITHAKIIKHTKKDYKRFKIFFDSLEKFSLGNDVVFLKCPEQLLWIKSPSLPSIISIVFFELHAAR